MPHSVHEATLVDRNGSGKLPLTVVLSLADLSNILLLWFHNCKHSLLPAIEEITNIDSVSPKVDLCPPTVLLLVLHLPVVQLLLLVQDQEAFVAALSRTAEVRAIFILFDEGEGDGYAAELVEGVHDAVDLLGRGGCVDCCHFGLEVVFSDGWVDVYYGFCYVSFYDLLGQDVGGVFHCGPLGFLDSADLLLHLPINKTAVPWPLLHTRTILSLPNPTPPLFLHSHPLHFRILHLLPDSLTHSILPNNSQFHLPYPFLTHFLGRPDHLLCPADLLQVLIVIPHQVGAIGETVVLVLVAEEVEVVDGCVLGGQEGVYTGKLVWSYLGTHKQNQIDQGWRDSRSMEGEGRVFDLKKSEKGFPMVLGIRVRFAEEESVQCFIMFIPSLTSISISMSLRHSSISISPNTSNLLYSKQYSSLPSSTEKPTSSIPQHLAKKILKSWLSRSCRNIEQLSIHSLSSLTLSLCFSLSLSPFLISIFSRARQS